MRKKLQHRMLIVLFALILVLASLTVLRFGFFNIKKIAIEGNTCVSHEEIRDSSGLAGQNFFLINREKTEESIKKKFICIKSAAISKSLPDKIVLKVLNRQAQVVLASLKSEVSSSATPSAEDVKDYELIDDEGVIFGKAENNFNLPQIFGYHFNDVKKALKILQKLKALGLETKESWISNNIFIASSNPPHLKISFSLKDNIDVQLASLQLIVDKAKIDSNQLEFIDLRFDKPVVKFAPKK